MILMTKIAFLLFIMYTMIYISYFGIPESYSNTFYVLNNKKKGLGSIFPITMVLLVALIMPNWFIISDSINSTFTFLCFLAGGGLLMVAASPFFKEQSKECGNELKNLIYRSFHGQGLVHTIGALISMISVITWTIIYNKWLAIILSLTFIICLMISLKEFKIKKLVFWCELFIFLLIFMILL